MTDKIQATNKKKGGLKVRAVLMALQILLPFGLYLAATIGSDIGAWLMAAAFTVSMGVLIWLG